MNMSKPEITMVPIDQIKPYDRNPRQNESAVDAVAESIRKYGFKGILLLDKDGVIIYGHTRWKAAKKLGMQELPCWYATDLTEEQAKEYRMLASVGAKLAITYSQENKQVILRAEAIETLGEEYTDDQIHLTVRDYRRGINHLICLGQGDLAERERIDLYADEDGNISTTQTITGVDERVEVYDYSNAESTEELQSGGEKRLKELMNYTTATLEVEDVTDLLIHDYVTAEETYTGMRVEEQVTGLTLTIENGQPTITYKLGDDD